MAISSPVPESPRERLARQKARLQTLRDNARQRYVNGEPGLQVAALISEMTDRLLLELLTEALQQASPADRQQIEQNATIIAVGGSGRGEMAPYSDADVLFLHRPTVPAVFKSIVAQTIRDCWDAGIKIGHSVRTLGDTIEMSLREPQFATSLVEARWMWGDRRLLNQLKWRFRRKVIQRRKAQFYNDCVSARTTEREQHGATVCQLEPDIKRSPGGLRDIHLIRWIGYATYGTPEIDMLRLAGALNWNDTQALLEAHEFLTRLRVEIHFSAGKAQEVLTRDEQLRLADLYGFVSTPGQRGVERFMQTVFRHTTGVAEITDRFIARNRPEKLLARVVRYLLRHRSNIYFLVAPDEIDIVPRYRALICNDLERLLNVFELAGLYSVKLSPRLVEEVKQAVPNLARQVSSRAARTFLSILSLTGRVGTLLRSMYATGVLEILIPEMTHARCLLQFNQYHAYTVDEHSLRAVEAAEAFEKQTGALATAYRGVRQKNLLHLALLLHDLGKGFEEDHAIVGRRIAEAVGQRLQLSKHERDLLVYLVHKHLIMTLVAFRRDLSDTDTLLRFSRDVGSPEYLKLLYIHTACDMTAVGPTTWTEWKAELLTALYDRAQAILSGEPRNFGNDTRFEELLVRVHDLLRREAGNGDSISLEALRDQLRTFPPHYLHSNSAAQLVADLRTIEELRTQAVVVRSRYEPATNTTEYRLVTRDVAGSGLFSKITGVLTAKWLEVLSAEVCTTTEGVVDDAFRVVDSDHAGEIPEFRLQEVESALRDVVTGARTVESLLQRSTRFGIKPKLPATVSEPTRVVIDNESSERCSIIDVFTNDRPGVLYTIAAALFELNLSVQLAKITTHVDQVLDVFYVTDRAGSKLHDDAALQQFHDTLVQRLDAHSRSEGNALSVSAHRAPPGL